MRPRRRLVAGAFARERKKSQGLFSSAACSAPLGRKVHEERELIISSEITKLTMGCGEIARRTTVVLTTTRARTCFLRQAAKRRRRPTQPSPCCSENAQQERDGGSKGGAADDTEYAARSAKLTTTAAAPATELTAASVKDAIKFPPPPNGCFNK